MGQTGNALIRQKDFHFAPESEHLCLHLCTPKTPVVASASQITPRQSLGDVPR
jgi:hypothetical protein